MICYYKCSTVIFMDLSNLYIDICTIIFFICIVCANIQRQQPWQ